MIYLSIAFGEIDFEIEERHLLLIDILLKELALNSFIDFFRALSKLFKINSRIPTIKVIYEMLSEESVDITTESSRGRLVESVNSVVTSGYHCGNGKYLVINLNLLETFYLLLDLFTSLFIDINKLFFNLLFGNSDSNNGSLMSILILNNTANKLWQTILTVLNMFFLEDRLSNDTLGNRSKLDLLDDLVKLLIGVRVISLNLL